jgi:OmpA-OmpF porin, OOP family
MKGNSMKKITLLSTVCVLAILPQVASAATPNFYLGAAAGADILRDSRLQGGAVNQRAEFDAGWVGQFTLGHHFTNNIRGELELGYRSNAVDTVGSVDADGSAHTWSLMANALYDFANTSPFTPYIGAGAGVARVDYSNVEPVGLIPTGSTRIDSSDVVPAVQGIVGVSYNLNDKITFVTSYQYLTAVDARQETDLGQKVDANYDSHSILVGARFNFGGPAPVVLREEKVATAAAPVTETVQSVPEKTYLVFFDFDQAVITPEGMKILEEAAANAGKANVVRINVTGHTDRSGTDKYNQRLSEKRAAAVKNALIKLGLNAKEIVTMAKGESEPLVATDDGVREPQNRRVEIVYVTQEGK